MLSITYLGIRSVRILRWALDSAPASGGVGKQAQLPQKVLAVDRDIRHLSRSIDAALRGESPERFPDKLHGYLVRVRSALSPVESTID